MDGNMDIVDEGSVFERDRFGPGSGYWEAQPNNLVLVNTSNALIERAKKKKSQKRWLFGRAEQKEREEYRLEVQLTIEEDTACGAKLNPLPIADSRQQLLSSQSLGSEQKILISSFVIFSINTTVSSRKERQLPVLPDCPTTMGSLTVKAAQESSSCLLAFSLSDSSASCPMPIDSYITSEIKSYVSDTLSRIKRKQTASREGEASDSGSFSSGAAVMTAITGTFFGVIGLALSLWTIYVGDVILLEIA